MAELEGARSSPPTVIVLLLRIVLACMFAGPVYMHVCVCVGQCLGDHMKWFLNSFPFCAGMFDDLLYVSKASCPFQHFLLELHQFSVI